MAKTKVPERKDQRIKRIMRKGDLSRRDRFLKKQDKYSRKKVADLAKVLVDLKDEFDALEAEELRQKPVSIADLHALAEKHRDYIYDLQEGAEKNFERAMRTLKEGGVVNEGHLLEIGGYLGEIDKRKKDLNTLVDEIEKVKRERLSQNEEIFRSIVPKEPTIMSEEEEQEELNVMEIEAKEEAEKTISDFIDHRKPMTIQTLEDAFERWEEQEASSITKEKKKKAK